MRAPQGLANRWLGSIAVAAVALAAAGPLRAQTPTAVNDTYGTAPGTPLQVPAATGVLANDTGGPLTAVLVSTVSHGVLLLDGGGGFFYLANIGFTGNDSFTYQATSGAVTSNVATVTIAVNSVNDPPVAVADSYSTNEGATLNVAAATGVLRNDSDADKQRSDGRSCDWPLERDVDSQRRRLVQLRARGRFFRHRDVHVSSRRRHTQKHRGDRDDHGQRRQRSARGDGRLVLDQRRLAARRGCGERRISQRHRPRSGHDADRGPDRQRQQRHSRVAAQRLVHLYARSQLQRHGDFHLPGERRFGLELDGHRYDRDRAGQ